MRKILAQILAVVSATAILAGIIGPAQADGGRRFWRGSPHGSSHGSPYGSYAVGAISRNVITPYYVGYYGSHYSYFRPDPVPPPTYVRYVGVPVLCWSPELGFLPC
jgi:hypothetical protein